MECDAEGGAAYINRPGERGYATIHDRPSSQGRLSVTGRAVDRMLLALRGYEQRAQQRAALHMWMMTRRAAAEAARG